MGTNRYAYAGNDPVNLRDPGGNFTISGTVDADASIFGYGGGVSFSSAISLHVNDAGKLEFQTGFVLAPKVPARMALAVNEQELGPIGELLLSADTGYSLAASMGVSAGFEDVPSTVETMAGSSTEGSLTCP